MQEMQIQPPGWEYPLEKETAAHFRVLAGKLRGQSSLADDSLQRVEHNRAYLHVQYPSLSMEETSKVIGTKINDRACFPSSKGLML